MPKRGENVRKRKDGRWEGRYRNKNDGSGKYHSVYGHSYKEVKEKLKEIEKATDTNEMLQNKDPIFQEVLLQWLHMNCMRCKEATENKYEYLIYRHILPELGNCKVSELSSQRINEFIIKKSKSGRLNASGGLSAAYVRSMTLIITSALHFAEMEQLCNPVSIHICRPSVEKKELQILNIEAQKSLERICFYKTDLTKLGVLLSLLLGLRLGEVCALTWKNIDLTTHVVHVRATVTRVKKRENGIYLTIGKPKTKTSERDIPIPNRLYMLLQQMYPNRVSDYVISNQESFLNPRTYEYRFQRLLTCCGIPLTNYHALRHTFATRCIEAGVDVKSLSEILGHANISITMNTYVHSSMELKRAQMEKLEQLVQ